ncbi:B3/4 domain-containing protein [Rhizobium sp. PP-F2F-G36]|nr:B3/4 domain-containing protein [Rhizobium sp. PP-F2F-G36]
MIFRYSDTMRSTFPELASRLLTVSTLHPNADVADAVSRFQETACKRLAVSSEGDFPEIQAWRRGFAKMGLKPTQYRCASEALLRRFRKDGALPSLHPLIDLCNALSLGYALPIAVFDIAKLNGTLEVRPACGEEPYETFSGEIERPELGEIIFADAGGRAMRGAGQTGKAAIPPFRARPAPPSSLPRPCTRRQKRTSPV